MKILIALGTRPEIIKLQPVISEALKRKGIGTQLLHTGQHYDWNMSLSFFREFRLRTPDYFLDVKSGTQGAQLSRIISRAEKVLLESEPDFVVVEGDTNSAVGVAIAAAKNGIRVAHVEAGCRSFERNMQEEINRVLIADLASINFPPTDHCARNLLKEGIPKERISMTGHPIVDILHRFRKESLLLEFRSRLGLRSKKYALVTIHRNENVENEEKLSSMLEELQRLALNIKLVFPIHPHTRQSLKKFGLFDKLNGTIVIDPTNYAQTLSLIHNARIVLTDSGGIQQEAALLGTPCVTLRNTTEWIETVNHGVNFLARTPKDIVPTFEFVKTNSREIDRKLRSAKSMFGELGASSRILDALEREGDCK